MNKPKFILNNNENKDNKKFMEIYKIINNNNFFKVKVKS